MTHPNILHNTRSCAKWRSGVLLVAMLSLIPNFRVAPSLAAADRGHPETDRYRGRKEVLAPAAVTDLQARPLSDSAVVLTWTEVRSSNSSIPRYVVRFDTAGKFAWFDEPSVSSGGCAFPIIGSNTAGGRLHACVLSGLKPNVAYQFQIAAYTGTLSSTTVLSPLSNVVSTPLFERVFDSILVLRQRIFVTDLTIASASLSDFGDRRFPLAGTFSTGDRVAMFYDSTGAKVAGGYFLVIPQ